MRKTMFIFISAALLAGTALAGSAVARDRSDRGEMSANQLANQADARTAEMKADLRLTPDQEKNWSGFASAMQDMNKKQADHQIAMRDERNQKQAPFDALDQMRKRADFQIQRSNDRKKLADAAQPLYSSLDEQQKRRFADGLFRTDRDRDRDHDAN
jgi:LTXXQ motif family protein